MSASHPRGTRLIKNSVLTLFNQFFMMATSWVISIWVARQLGPANYGIFSLVLWLSGTVSWAVGMGLIHAITKYVAEYDGKNGDAQFAPIIWFVLRIEVVLTATVTLVLIFFQTQIADYFFSPEESFFFFLAFLGLLPGVITAIFSAAIDGIQKFEYFTYAGLIISPFSFAAKIVVLLMGQGIPGLLIVMLVFSVVNCIFYYVVLRKEGLLRFSRIPAVAADLKRRILRYNASVAAILVCDKVVWDKSENFFLGRLCSATEVGYYNLGFNLAKRFMAILPETFWRVLFPAMSNYFGTGDREKMRRLFFVTTRYLAFFTFPVGVAGMMLSYQILLYLYGYEYVSAQRVLQILFISSIFGGLSNPAAAILYGYEKQSFIYKWGAVLAVINIGLDIMLIKPYGALGAAVCFAITTGIGSIGGLIYTCRKMELDYPFASVFKILFSTIIMGLAMQMVLMRDKELAGTIIALGAGACVYLVCSLVLGTFENEDYTLLESVKVVLPGKCKKAVDWLIGFIAQFKRN